MNFKTGRIKMKVTINDKTYSTYDAQCLGYRHIGEFGHHNGFEEQLYIAEDGQYFLYSIGGPESPYAEPKLNLLSDVKAKNWKSKAMPKDDKKHIPVNDEKYTIYHAQCLGYRHIGEFGHDDGFEEQLYIAQDGQHFLYGAGGPESPYNEPVIKLLTNRESKAWLKENKN
jgi:hypothetical protein